MSRNSDSLFIEAEITGLEHSQGSTRISLSGYRNLSFVVERAKSYVNCRETEVKGLRVEGCYNQILARNLRKDENVF